MTGLMLVRQYTKDRAVTMLASAAALLSAAELLNLARGPSFDFATRYAAGIAVSRGSSPYDQTALGKLEQRVSGSNFG